ncbi:putative bifunctional diguanylate cyclase/phosphodiesterase [Salimicrobium flavidum]|uniref:PAS domain S-box-containing protein/diguanylate cyclase (GGDEF) domain-containing protein n=1 Tax=Salimicrobium flavidum TaxID=570947 RepID=A0A1N7J9H8_9BACI|nr:EAL domain-containing protein [Salimicrobium flavidum]SIS46009.1 PAS domain S-box-containing protein/diguanylate cyclase (GGDEF) domain-containing protein [Salimicrobium flavidum]
MSFLFISASTVVLLPLSIRILLMATVILAFLLSLIVIKRVKRQRSKAENRSRFTDKLNTTIVRSANDAIITFDEQKTILSWNRSAETIFGYQRDEMIGELLSTVMPGGALATLTEEKEPRGQEENHKNVEETVKLEGLRKTGDLFPLELSFSVVQNEGERYFIGIARDISERKAYREKIKQLVYRDELTSLPNRRMLEEKLEQDLKLAKETNYHLGVTFIDMDRFKQINHVYGHKAGDELLIAMASRLEKRLPEEGFLARQSGDEFIIVYYPVLKQEQLQLADSIIGAFHLPFELEEAGTDVYMSPSIGMSLYPEDGATPEELIKNADVAMYEAKKNGGGQTVFFIEDLKEALTEKARLERDLRRALENDELFLHFQPQVSVTGGGITGFEALVRWKHPDYGVIPPNTFIPIAEETGLIISMGEEILRKACQQFTDWKDEGYRPGCLSVNISTVQFRHPQFMDMIKQTLATHSVAPSELILEMTESVVQEVEEAFPVLQQLHQLGVRVALDDFGKGYSSLNYLKSLPLDILKIDKSFIQAIHLGTREKAIIETVMNLGTKLEMQIIAEGVERPEQLEYLIQSPSLTYQGFYFSAPLPPEKVPTILTDPI